MMDLIDTNVVTRNTQDFAPTGARLINPWECRG